MKQVLVVAAEKWEFDGIVRRAGRPERFHCAVRFSGVVKWNEAVWVLAAHGPGPKLAAHAAGSAMDALAAAGRRLDGVISAGLCGGLDPNLRVGDIVVATEVNGEPAKAPETARPYKAGPVVSEDRVAGTAEQKRRLFDRGAVAVEMEAAGVAAAVDGSRLPFYCIRAVSDEAGESFGVDLNAARDRFGRFDPGAILGQALRSPFRLLPELLRLRRNSRLAVEALGEFFASCRF